GPERVYRRALQYFTVQEITEGVAGPPRAALPPPLRHQRRAPGPGLHGAIRSQRGSARRIGLWAAMLALVVLATLNIRLFFSNEIAVATPLNRTDVDCGHLEPLWLIAQSVPSASLVPCLQLVPVDWKVAEVAVNNGRSVITLDHDRGGKAAMGGTLPAAAAAAFAGPP